MTPSERRELLQAVSVEANANIATIAKPPACLRVAVLFISAPSPRIAFELAEQRSMSRTGRKLSRTGRKLSGFLEFDE